MSIQLQAASLIEFPYPEVTIGHPLGVSDSSLLSAMLRLLAWVVLVVVSVFLLAHLGMARLFRDPGRAALTTFPPSVSERWESLSSKRWSCTVPNAPEGDIKPPKILSAWRNISRLVKGRPTAFFRGASNMLYSCDGAQPIADNLLRDRFHITSGANAGFSS